ncbi:hypothetical protein EV175_007164 [Coemansia sp. RSA 1933]|nr:hypothetical protein EV175_007164 [Coemansia sp. RSA 1933]
MVRVTVETTGAALEVDGRGGFGVTVTVTVCSSDAAEEEGVGGAAVAVTVDSSEMVVDAEGFDGTGAGFVVPETVTVTVLIFSVVTAGTLTSGGVTVSVTVESQFEAELGCEETRPAYDKAPFCMRWPL